MKTFNKLILSIALLMCIQNVNAQTTVPQVINSSQTWTPSGSPYIVDQNILVKGGSTVKVMPGTKIRGTGNFRIILESGAGFEAVGTKDSVIAIDTVNFEFLKGSIGHNFTSGGGSVFSYCFFRGTGMGGVQTITLAETPLLISNCRFWNTYYTIYGINANTTAVKVRIEKSIFEGLKFNYGYVIYAMGSKSELEMDECVVKTMYGLYLANTSTITKSLFYDIYSSISVIGSKKVVFKCNTFRKFKYSILDISSTNPAISEIVIVSNTFDSAENHIDYKVFSNSLSKLVCKNNNFLKFNKNSIILSGGSKPGFADTLVFTKNYWGTTSTAQIAKGILDIKDDITIAGLVDFANYHSAMVSNCIEDESEEAFVGESAKVKNIAPSDFHVFPNPARDFIAIESNIPDLQYWRIYTVSGQMMAQGELSKSTSLINISNIPNGLYFLSVGNGERYSDMQKIVVNK